jgi:hypothetical protein
LRRRAIVTRCCRAIATLCDRKKGAIAWLRCLGDSPLVAQWPALLRSREKPGAWAKNWQKAVGNAMPPRKGEKALLAASEEREGPGAAFDSLACACSRAVVARAADSAAVFRSPPFWQSLLTPPITPGINPALSSRIKSVQPFAARRKSSSRTTKDLYWGSPGGLPAGVA